MTAQSKKRVPRLLGPNWQGVPVARACAPQGSSFHASLQECANELNARAELEPVKLAALQKRESRQLQNQRPQLHISLLNWLSAKSAAAANKKQQAIPLEANAFRFSPARQPQSSLLAHIWSWLQTKYASSATKRLRVAEMVPLGEKRFLAVVCVEGREFLVGGGASGVSVVTQLDTARLDTARDTAPAPHGKFEFQGAIE